jgi:tetratricopeptide (TPR) repeat protein
VARVPPTHVDDALAVGLRIREARESAGISQRQLAFPGCSPAYLSRIEKGERVPSLQVLREIGRRLGVGADFLATGSDGVEDADPLLAAEAALRVGELEEAESLYREALAGDLGRRDAARAAVGLGQIAFDRGDHRTAIDELEDALESPLLSEPDRVNASDTLGRAYALIGELEQAIGIFERRLADARGSGNFVDIARFAVLLANALVDARLFARAADTLGSVLAHVDDSTDPLLRARLWWSQSRLHSRQDNPDLAARYARMALHTIELTEHTLYAARARQLLAMVEIDSGNPEEALRLLDEGYPLVVASGNRFEQAVFQLDRARALAQLGERDRAISIALECAATLGETSPVDAGRSYAVVAETLEELGDVERAIELYELALELIRPGESYGERISMRLAELLERTGRKDEALEVLKRVLGAKTAAPARESV